MTAMLMRLLVAVLAVAGGVLAGRAVGLLFDAGWVGSLVGATLAVLVVDATGAWRGARLMNWLRGSLQQPAPRDAGFWGELGYRIEKALRTRELQVQAEQARLQEFLSAIEASPNGVMLLDANDQMVWCNSVTADHFDLDPVRDRQQRITNLVRVPAFVAYLQGAQWDEALAFSAASGRRLSVLVRPYGAGQKLVLSQDVTERERADAMRRDFVANVSHEIRTPLTVLAGFVETMASLPLTETERARVLVLMGQQTQRMQALVGDLLQLAHLEGSPRPPPDRWVPVATLMKRAEADAAALSAGRHVLAFHGGEDLEIAGLETELQSALGNLVHNAVRYTPEGGAIDVRALRREDGGLDLDVTDTGPGIAREHLPRLTERFYRVDSSRSRETGGTGLGLAIVKHVAQRHGGEVDITSEPGKGSRFRLVFPAARVRQRAGAAALPAAAAAAES